MEIIVTNDDGINAPGIRALAEAAATVGNVTVIAPDKNWSACGHHKALGRPLRADPADFPGGFPAWSSDGSPSDCTCLAGLGFLDKKTDLVVSGINPSPNLGQDMTYSGTVTAALEGVFWGMQGIAFSIACARMDPASIDFSAAKQIIPYVIRQVIAHPLPPYIILNVNIPYLPYEEIKGYRITKSCTRDYRDVLIRCKDPFGRPYYWFGGDAPAGHPDEGTDIRALEDGYISIHPLHLDLTAYDMLSEVESWGWEK